MYINPWIFYWINILDELDIVSILSVFIFGVLFTVFVCLTIACEVEGEDADTKKKVSKYLKRFAIMFFTSILLAIFIPSKETCYQMLIASQVTEENVDKAKETVKEVADYIVDAAKEIKGGRRVTNMDYIKSCTKEELAKLLCVNIMQERCSKCIVYRYCYSEHIGFLDWLDKERGEKNDIT